MKKTLLTVTLLCVALTLHALDYRQVIFGNSYENIIEVDADGFFEQYEESVNSVRKVYIPEDFSYRVYRQDIGNETYFRILRCALPYSNEDMLDWKKLDFAQYLFEESKTKENVLYDYFMTGFIPFNKNGQRGIEIIVRDDVVRGFLEFGNNSATYTPKGELGNDFYFMISNALIDSRRPFMYTIQNAFDGNPKTSYVEDTFDNMFSLLVIPPNIYNEDTSMLIKPTRYMVINGYADGDYYFQNNQILKVSVAQGDEYGYRNGIGRLHKRGDFYLKTTTKKQFFSTESVMYTTHSDYDNYFSFTVDEVVAGSAYNDTCIAELDIYFDSSGWLFGSTDTDALDVGSKVIGNYVYTFLNDTAILTRYNGNDPHITIPSQIQYEGKLYTVSSIGFEAFYNNTNLISVTLPNTIITIGEGAFNICENLTSIHIPDSLIEIGELAFNNTSIHSISLPIGLEKIGDAAFSRTKINSITIPQDITNIESYTFYECVNLETITILSKHVAIANINTGNPKTTYHVYSDSVAHKYAIEHNIPYVLLN